MKTIKGFEGEEIAVSNFGEWVGKDYIDYKFEYKNNQKVIKELFKENQELKKQLEEKENQQLKEDISFYLKSIKQEMEMSADSRTRQEMLSCYQILSKWSDK